MAKNSSGTGGYTHGGGGAHERPSKVQLSFVPPTGGARVQGPSASQPTPHPSQKSHMKDC